MKIRERQVQFKLTVLHKGEFKPTTLEITRGEITVPSLTLSYVGDSKDVALIDITRFTEASLSEWNAVWDRAVDDIVESGVKKVMLDLRGNPGGFFDAAIYAADDF